MGATILKGEMEHSFDDPSKGIEGPLSQAHGVNLEPVNYDLLNRQKLSNQIILWLGGTFAHITIHNRQKSSCTFFTALPSPNNFIEKVTVHYLFSRKIQGQHALLLSLRIEKQFPFLRIQA